MLSSTRRAAKSLLGQWDSTICLCEADAAAQHKELCRSNVAPLRYAAIARLISRNPPFSQKETTWPLRQSCSKTWKHLAKMLDTAESEHNQEHKNYW
jgi:hypothetical protein